HGGWPHVRGLERVVFDTSVLLAAAGSPQGGSSLVMEKVSGSASHEAIASATILREAHANLRLKFDSAALVRFYALLAALRPRLVESQDVTVPADLPASVAAKDHHIIRICIWADATMCLSLDRRHLLTHEVRRWGMARSLRFMSPGEFLEFERIRLEE